jgi:hypothetical protein
VGRQDEMQRTDLYAPIDASRMERMNNDLLAVVQAVQKAWRRTPIALRSLPRAVNPARASFIPAKVSYAQPESGQGHVSRFIQDMCVNLIALGEVSFIWLPVAYINFALRSSRLPKAPI